MNPSCRDVERGLRVRIHRGAREIGGNCVELWAAGARLVLDLGLPLSAADGDAAVALPAVAGLETGDDPTLLGVLVSHSHADHVGLLGRASPRVPVFMGRAAERVLKTAARLMRGSADFVVREHLSDRKTLTIGPFVVTALLNDHSAFDAYSLLIEAEGRRLFYTGDFRGHGRKARVFEALLARPPAGIDCLLMEGTQVRGAGAPPRAPLGGCYPTEQALDHALADELRAVPGLGLVAFSPQSIDRLVSVYRACRRAGRELVMDFYTAQVAQACGLSSIPQPGFAGVRVYLPVSQRRRLVRTRTFDEIEALRRFRIFPEELCARRGELAMVFRGSMAEELDDAGCLDGATVFWSQWHGYLERGSGATLRASLHERGIPLRLMHCSGHATVADCQRLARALSATMVVPIHTEGGDTYADLFENVSVQPDGQWWVV